jgi:glycosyltransferase involved in cell wall biosynthesis
MRIVLVATLVAPETVGGLPRYVRELATALARADCEVVVLANRVAAGVPAVETAADGVRIVRHEVPSQRNPRFAPADPLYTACGVLGLSKAVMGPDTVVHAHCPVTALPLALSRTRFLYTFHAPRWREFFVERQDGRGLATAVRRALRPAVQVPERLVIRRTGGTFVASEFMRRELTELSPRAAGEATLIEGGIDIRRFSPDSTIARAEPQTPLLFTARRLIRRNGVDRLVAAMPAILRSHPKATLVLAGVGDLEAQLRTLVSELGLSKHVRFLGRISDRALVDWYCRATLVVVPTASLGGVGLGAGEALACGTPVLGTPVGALPELLESVDPSLVAPASSARAVAYAACRLLDVPARLAAIGARCRARVAPAMGWDAIAEQYVASYEAVLAENRGRARGES